MECVNLSWLASPWFLGGLIGAFCTFVLITAFLDISGR